MNALDRITADPRVACAYKDSDGYWVTLQNGYRADVCDYTHTVHETTVRDLTAAMRHVHPCDCDDCLSYLAVK